MTSAHSVSQRNTMQTSQALLFVALASFVSAAPPSDEPAECAPMKDKEAEISECCKLVSIVEKADAVKECMALVKDKPVAGADKPGTLPKPEGFDCMDDCVMIKAGLMGADKKIDTAKIATIVKSKFTGDWATVGTTLTKKCLELAGTGKGMCPSGADDLMTCFFREAYMNCPEKSWTDSAACKANKERLTKCPKALPFMKMGKA